MEILYKSEDDSAEHVLDKLKEICKALEADENIKKRRKEFEYSKVAFEKREELNKLIRCLNVIEAETRLNQTKCKILKSRVVMRHGFRSRMASVVAFTHRKSNKS